MREFPSKLTPNNLKDFKQYKYDRDLCYLREAVYEHMICETVKEETKERESLDTYDSPFSLESFVTKRQPVGLFHMVNQITIELKRLGWTVTCGRNSTDMWVYPTGAKPPKSIPEW